MRRFHPFESVAFNRDAADSVTDVNADVTFHLTGISNQISGQYRTIRLPFNINFERLNSADVEEYVVGEMIVICRVVFGPRSVLMEQDTNLDTTNDIVVLNEIVGVSMSNRYIYLHAIDDLVVLNQAILDFPSEEKTGAVALKKIAAHQGPLRSGTRVQSQVDIVVNVAILDDDIVGDLPTHGIAVVIPRRDIENRDTGAVLKEDAARIVSLDMIVCDRVSFEGHILDRHVADILPVEQSAQRGRGCVAFNPRILAQAAVQLKAIAATSKERSANHILKSVSRPRSA